MLKSLQSKQILTTFGWCKRQKGYLFHYPTLYITDFITKIHSYPEELNRPEAKGYAYSFLFICINAP